MNPYNITGGPTRRATDIIVAAYAVLAAAAGVGALAAALLLKG